MQRVSKKRMSRGRAFAILGGWIAGIAIVVVIIVSVVNYRPVSGVYATQLPCPYSDTIAAFGEYVLYYDDASLHCMTSQGTVRWSFSVGANADYACSDTHVVLWKDSTVYILDQNGKATYNDNLGDTIQFAVVGDNYIGAVVGENTASRLIVKDLQGAHMDEESEAYVDLIVLDVGFYGANGEYMWTLALDVFGTASNTVLNTYEVGKMNTGSTSLGEYITYAVLYENSKLRIISTRTMLTFSDRGTQDTTASLLVYGWRLLANGYNSRGEVMMLYAPTAQTESIFDIRELRLISGTTDKRYNLPDTSIGATIWNESIYAFSETQLFRAGQYDSRFATYDLPITSAATSIIGTLTDGNVILACGTEVYVVSLPQTSNSLI